ncbi:MAG: hypothetical protein QMC95_03310 [Desulfitobacteriaceae bacterium]|nr:hypothetical protein [Desulfitobacteriaceae bacterium]MDI6879584.1 hypothetical protein [Desulfitobacteriaceae bacterium]MDI6913231.1 hypothetical protein [Desulfitobacteriaceae bacterium]
MLHRLTKIQTQALHGIRHFLDIMILVLLVLGIVSFVGKWLSPLFFHAHDFFDSFYPMIDQLFLIIVMLEVADVLHKVSPVRLMDILMTILVRKIIVIQENNVLWLDVSIFALIALIRLAWTKWIPDSDTYCSDDEPNAARENK